VQLPPWPRLSPFAPAPSVGLPPGSANFYCSAARKACFFKQTSAVTFTSARSVCTAAGGDLVAMTSYEKQLEVEKALAPASYWLGIERVCCCSGGCFQVALRSTHGMLASPQLLLLADTAFFLQKTMAGALGTGHWA
jgi:hypothetical protein